MRDKENAPNDFVRRAFGFRPILFVHFSGNCRFADVGGSSRLTRRAAIRARLVAPIRIGGRRRRLAWWSVPSLGDSGFGLRARFQSPRWARRWRRHFGAALNHGPAVAAAPGVTAMMAAAASSIAAAVAATEASAMPAMTSGVATMMAAASMTTVPSMKRLGVVGAIGQTEADHGDEARQCDPCASIHVLSSAKEENHPCVKVRTLLGLP